MGGPSQSSYDQPHPIPSGSSLGKTPSLAPDPRTSSAQSLAPSEIDYQTASRGRTLLLIYIHGFYGNDQSFQSFPYHVHSYLRQSLKESHVIHSKIYPRYKTYRAIEIARDNFSAWLAPHEGPNTDIILVGHSMGGILAADVVLMPNRSPYDRYPYKHRVLGIISLDCPFLGLHPGIVVAGLSSLFRSSSDQQNEEASSSATTPEPPSSVPAGRQHTMDPFFNPTFWNDNPFKEAPFVKRIMHFASKHKKEGIVNATAKHVLSHLEYGGCLADFNGLNKRYAKIRELEDVDDLAGLSGSQVQGDKARVRFVNYYTLSSGRKKPPKSPGSGTPSQELLTPATSQNVDDGSLISRETTRESGESSFRASNVSISAGDQSEKGDSSAVSPMSRQSSIDPAGPSKNPNHEESLPGDLEQMSLQQLDPTPIFDENLPEADRHVDLPPIPEMSARPTTPNFDQYEDKDARRLVEKEHKQALKVHASQVKARNKAIRERAKIIDKRRAKSLKDQKTEEAADARSVQELIASSAAASTPSLQQQESNQASVATADSEVAEAAKPKKSKKFCTLPRKQNDNGDPCWVDIYMDGMDEVSAHCGLFFPGPHYETLVGDVGARIIGWVQDDMTKRMILDMESGQQ